MAEQEKNLGGAPVGNQNAKNAHRAKRALIRALARQAGGDADEAIAKIWDAAILKAYEGSEPHAKLIIERIDGRPVQAIEHTGLGGGPIQTASAAEILSMPQEKFAILMRAFRLMGIDPATAEMPDA